MVGSGGKHFTLFFGVGSPWLLTYLFFGQKMPVCSQNVGE
jgi:hypothetical protein